MRRLLFLLLMSSIFSWPPTHLHAGGCGSGGAGIFCQQGSLNAIPNFLPPILYRKSVEGLSPSLGRVFTPDFSKYQRETSCPVGLCAELEIGGSTANIIAAEIQDAAGAFETIGIPWASQMIQDPEKMQFLQGIHAGLMGVSDILVGKVPEVVAPGSVLERGIRIVRPQNPYQSILGEYRTGERDIRIYADPVIFMRNPSDHRVVGIMVHEIGHALFNQRRIQAGVVSQEIVKSAMMLTEIFSYSMENVFGNPQSPGIVVPLAKAPNLATYYARRGYALSQIHPRYRNSFMRYMPKGSTPTEWYGIQGRWALSASPLFVFPQLP